MKKEWQAKLVTQGGVGIVFTTKTQAIQEAILKQLESSRTGLTNAELGGYLGLPYRTIQRNTLALNEAGKIVGLLLHGTGEATWKLAKDVTIKK